MTYSKWSEYFEGNARTQVLSTNNPSDFRTIRLAGGLQGYTKHPLEQAPCSADRDSYC